MKGITMIDVPKLLDNQKQLLLALKTMVYDYNKLNPIQNAAYHGSDCTCPRCNKERAEAIISKLMGGNT